MPIRKARLPRTSGILTFAGAQRATIEELEPGMVAVFGVPYESSSPTKLGPQDAPRAYRETSNYYLSSTDPGAQTIEVNTRERFENKLFSRKLRDIGDLRVAHHDWAMTEGWIGDAVHRIASRGAVPVGLGGDHFVTYGLIQGYKKAISGGNIGYIQFSSRLDMGGVDPVWGEVWRGATVRRIIDSGIARPENVVWIGANGYVRLEEWERANAFPDNIFTVEDVQRDGIEAVTTKALEIAGKGTDGIYASVDMDVVDGGYVAMTGAPQLDGLRNVDVWNAMDVLAAGKVGALDLCGLNPLIETMSLGKTGQRFGTHLVLRYAHATIKKLAGQA